MVGAVVGGVLTVVQHAFVWQEDSGIVDIGTLNETANNLAQAYDINDAGVVVGTARNLFGTASQAFLWENGQGDLLPVAEFAAAFSINSVGQIAGQGFDPTPEDDSSGPRAILSDPDDGVIDLGTVAGTSTSSASSVNEHGHVVGSSGHYAFVWENGVMSPLPLGSLESASATAINNEGAIVGFGFDPSRTALVWDEGMLLQLNDLIDPTLGWDLEYASDINDRGQIVGWGTREGFGTSFRAFLLTPTVEQELQGDYNFDGSVDAADYVIWRKNDGSQDEYEAWRANFGATGGSGVVSNATVPEPSSTLLFLSLVAAAGCRRGG